MGESRSCWKYASSETPPIQCRLCYLLALLLHIQNQYNIKQSRAIIKLSLFSWMYNALGLMAKSALCPVTRIKCRFGFAEEYDLNHLHANCLQG